MVRARNQGLGLLGAEPLYDDADFVLYGASGLDPARALELGELIRRFDALASALASPRRLPRLARLARLKEVWHNSGVSMAKTKNLLATATLTVSTNPLVENRLERLVSTGYYGKNIAEAAERLIAQTLNTLEKQGEIPAEVSK